MYISRVQLKRIRGFRDLDLRIFDEDNRPRMHTAIIGINGTGKTTLLRCIAMGLCGQADANALLAELTGRLIAAGEKDAEIIVDIVGRSGRRTEQTISTKIGSLKNQEAVESQTSFEKKGRVPFVVGYGIRAGIEGDSSFRQYRIADSVYTLFNYTAEFTSAELTLRRLRDHLGTDYYKRTLDGIKKALGLTQEVEFDLPRGGGVQVSGPSIGARIPLGSWADGYRITFSWILDLYSWAMRAEVVTKTGGIKGVLLIDELEKHIHPSLQTNVLSRLRGLWPELQIFGTTHSPLVTLGAHPKEVVVLRRDGDSIIADDNVLNFTGYSAEDMLQDKELFDTEVYAPELNLSLSRYKELSAKDKGSMSSKEKRELIKLSKDLYSQQILLAEEGAIHTNLRQLRKDLGLGDKA